MSNNLEEKKSLLEILKNYKRELLVSFVLLLEVWVIYFPILRHEFLIFDDYTYVVENYHIQEGITWSTVKWAFTNFYASNWHPLTWLSHALDYKIYGANPSGHFLTNIILHSINSILLFWTFYFLTNVFSNSLDKSSALVFSFLLSSIFAVHPLRVESVAWVSERKDLLSGFFWILSILIYGKYVKQVSLKNYLLLTLFFLLGLMSKPMVVTLPCVLFLLDIWPLNRLFSKENSFQLKNTVRLVLEKLPLLLLSAFSSLLTIKAQIGAMSSLKRISFSLRVNNSISAYFEYLSKFFFPKSLSVLYSLPESISYWKLLLAFLIILIVSILASKFLHKYPWLIVGWLWYLGTLIPVIGLVQVGVQSMADRYTYIPTIGIGIIFCHILLELIKYYPTKERIIHLISIGIILVLIGFSHIQVNYWKDTGTLFSHAVEIEPDNPYAHNIKGKFLLNQKQYLEASQCFQKSISLVPKFSEAENSLGRALSELNDPSAETHLKRAIEISPDYSRAYSDLGAFYFKQGKWDMADSLYKEAIKKDPKLRDSYFNLGMLYSEKKEYQLAEAYFKKTIELSPNYGRAYNNLATVYLSQNKTEEAISSFEEATKKDQTLFEAYYNLGILYSEKKDYQKAITFFKKVISLKPNWPDGYLRLAVSYLQINDNASAMEQYKVLLKIAPEKAANLSKYLDLRQ